MNSLKRMQDKCYQLGVEMEKEVDDETLQKLFAKVIVQEKILDDDAFEIANTFFERGRNVRRNMDGRSKGIIPSSL